MAQRKSTGIGRSGATSRILFIPYGIGRSRRWQPHSGRSGFAPYWYVAAKRYLALPGIQPAHSGWFSSQKSSSELVELGHPVKDNRSWPRSGEFTQKLQHPRVCQRGCRVGKARQRRRICAVSGGPALASGRSGGAIETFHEVLSEATPQRRRVTALMVCSSLLEAWLVMPEGAIHPDLWEVTLQVRRALTRRVSCPELSHSPTSADALGLLKEARPQYQVVPQH